MKILLADPDPLSRILISRLVTDTQHELVLAEDAAQVFKALEQQDPPEIVLIDVSSGMNGEEVCRQVRLTMGDGAPYMLLIGGVPDLGIDIEGDGPDDYIPKPLNACVFKARLRIASRLLQLKQRCSFAVDSEPEHDPLTGAWGRRAILDCLRAQFARSTRDGVSLAVILGDMDYFYAANAKHGQAICDAILRETARRIGRSIRPYDSLGRYAGEEFLVVAPDCTMSNAQGIAERLRSAISDHPFDVGDRRISATISFGVATTAETGALDQEGLLRSVDAALLSAKERGRNRVEAAKRILRPRIPHARFVSSSKPRELVQ